MIKKSKDTGVEEGKIIKRPVEKSVYAKESLENNIRSPKKVTKSLRLDKKIITAEGKRRKKQNKDTAVNC